jgi:hypothetical protein
MCLLVAEQLHMRDAVCRGRSLHTGGVDPWAAAAPALQPRQLHALLLTGRRHETFKSCCCSGCYGTRLPRLLLQRPTFMTATYQPVPVGTNSAVTTSCNQERSIRGFATSRVCCCALQLLRTLTREQIAAETSPCPADLKPSCSALHTFPECKTHLLHAQWHRETRSSTHSGLAWK